MGLIEPLDIMPPRVPPTALSVTVEPCRVATPPAFKVILPVADNFMVAPAVPFMVLGTVMFKLVLLSVMLEAPTMFSIFPVVTELLIVPFPKIL